MVCADWAKGGAEAIEKTRREQPGLYFRVVASLMPKQFKVENESANMTDEQIMQQIRQLDAQVAALVKHQLMRCSGKWNQRIGAAN